MNFDKELERYIKLTEQALEANLPEPDSNIAAEAMRYSIMGGGKRLRPVILLASSEAFGGASALAAALPFAAAIEMIHTYSLIHDDLPAMDNDDYRRGRLSCHKKYGEAYGILAGDGLLNRAYECIIGGLASTWVSDGGRGLIEAAGIIAGAAGIKGMISGQTADISFENAEVDEKTLLYINERKTGALISASFEAGAFIGGADSRDAKIFSEVGMKIGRAFQIRDDVLDQEGSFESLGKSAGSDKRNNKTTYATLLGKQECARRIDTLSREAVSLMETTGIDTGFLTELTLTLSNRSK